MRKRIALDWNYVCLPVISGTRSDLNMSIIPISSANRRKVYTTYERVVHG